MEPTKKAGSGRFEVWHVGYMDYEVRAKGSGDLVFARFTNLSQAFAWACDEAKRDQEADDLLDDFNYVGSRHHY